jgi:hypothetical protein
LLDYFVYFAPSAKPKVKNISRRIIECLVVVVVVVENQFSPYH